MVTDADIDKDRDVPPEKRVLEPGELPMLPKTDPQAMRGRDAAKRIRDTVLERRERGHQVVAVNVSGRTGDALIAYFRTFARYFGGYPTQVEGVPLSVVAGLSNDVEIMIQVPGAPTTVETY
jgi:hypothetical protein